MNIKTTIRHLAALLAGGALLLALAPSLAAQTPAAADNAVNASLQALFQKIGAKLQSFQGTPTEADFAAELKQFDDIIAANKGASPDALAQVLELKSSFYVEILRDFDKAAEIVRTAKANYPQARLAAQADEMLKQLDAMKRMQAISASLQPGKMFPDFSIKDISGAELSLAKFKGKVLLVDFWATWCPPCVAEMPAVIAAYQKYHGKGFEIVGISLDHEKDQLTAFIEKNKMPWPQYFDGKSMDGEFAQKYGVYLIPTTFLLDGEGKIIARDLRGAELEEQLAKVLGGK